MKISISNYQKFYSKTRWCHVLNCFSGCDTFDWHLSVKLISSNSWNMSYTNKKSVFSLSHLTQNQPENPSVQMACKCWVIKYLKPRVFQAKAGEVNWDEHAGELKYSYAIVHPKLHPTVFTNSAQLGSKRMTSCHLHQWMCSKPTEIKWQKQRGNMGLKKMKPMWKC